MKNKKFVSIFLILLNVFTLQASAQKSVITQKNASTLYIINNINTYKRSIQADSNKQMVALKDYVYPLITDWKYATKNNFTHKVLYHHPVALARLPVAKALQQVETELQHKGLGLKFYDAYRPYHVTVEMWKIVPDERYAANPSNGSGHNRGIAVDVSLIDLKTLKELPMPTAFDDFTEKAHQDYILSGGISHGQIKTMNLKCWIYLFKTSLKTDPISQYKSAFSFLL